MALETIVYPQDPFGYNNSCKEYHTVVAAVGIDSTTNWGNHPFDPPLPLPLPLPLPEDQEEEEDHKIKAPLVIGTPTTTSHQNSMTMMMTHQYNCRGPNNHWNPSSSSSSPSSSSSSSLLLPVLKDWAVDPKSPAAAVPGRRKRRRSKSSKNKEELESQRMTHIAVERNRRKQMNDYLSVIRSLMPSSYVQRGDQASIIGGAINFVKELEKLQQTLEVQKRSSLPPDHHHHQQQPNNNGFPTSPLFSDFFTFPQYSSTCSNNFPAAATATADNNNNINDSNKWGLGEIEVSMVESHANLKILTERRPRQLLKMVAGLQCLRLTILHLNVTTVHPMVLYSLSVKVEEGCMLTTVDEIADAVNHLLGRIQEEAAVLS